MRKDKQEWLKSFLDEQYLKYNNTGFIANDPICIPHQFKNKQDIEIAGFLSSTISWGNRASIIKNASRIMEAMDNNPYAFIKDFNRKNARRLKGIVHRTFNENDLIDFCFALHKLYTEFESLEQVFFNGYKNENSIREAIINFRNEFIRNLKHSHSLKHISNPEKNASAKRLCMFLRWMVRKDSHKVDFGIWKTIHTRDLMLPLDVHTGTVARTLGLLKRNSNDWQAVEEITKALRAFDQDDPVKYDYALFGIGVNKTL